MFCYLDTNLVQTAFIFSNLSTHAIVGYKYKRHYFHKIDVDDDFRKRHYEQCDKNMNRHTPTSVRTKNTFKFIQCT